VAAGYDAMWLPSAIAFDQLVLIPAALDDLAW
jgi:hypothetical protein